MHINRHDKELHQILTEILEWCEGDVDSLGDYDKESVVLNRPELESRVSSVKRAVALIPISTGHETKTHDAMD